MIEIPWSEIEPQYKELLAWRLTPASLPGWLAEWSRLANQLDERLQRLYVAITVNTDDAAASQRYNSFLDEVYSPAREAEQSLRKMLLESSLSAPGLEVPLRTLRAEAALFRAENLPLLNAELKLATQHDSLAGAQTVTWEGEEKTLLQLQPILAGPDRSSREAAWRLAAERQLADREAIDRLWVSWMELRSQLAANSGLPDYRAYRWQQLWRLDYTPADCARFHRAIETVAVPAAQRIYEKRQALLGLASMRPWDLEVDPLGRPPLRPFENARQLEDGCAAIFQRVDPRLGKYFEIMRREKLLDLENHKGKAPGGYCTEFRSIRRPFIFMNAVGLHDDVQTLLHEGGHAFHVFAAAPLPYHLQLQIPLEFMEVASMGMELLSYPYLEAGGFYATADADRARAENLERWILFWPYMAVVDAFQHWAYENHTLAADPANCDACWGELWQRFMPGQDWCGLEDALSTGWQRKAHLLQTPFYYIEYGLAQMGALQVWRGASRDPAGSAVAYHQALALGGTATLPQLYAAAGARLAFDASALGDAIAFAEHMIESYQ